MKNVRAIQKADSWGQDHVNLFVICKQKSSPMNQDLY